MGKRESKRERRVERREGLPDNKLREDEVDNRSPLSPGHGSAAGSGDRQSGIT